ncbi:type II toxin-antitoxin system death-on-curing family toxin [Aureimonas sp. AU40]|uniref:type II toxin-antitoxin system death-on-curing family toxin n=1 Tax=Aureimonas sp. AU40 TaxID=1637747 RepID=UPI000781C774|nr:type II toxin-antitoxin system death-on-curing family toxin [Aureimonas sp. AU40]
MIFLTVEQVIGAHDMILEATGIGVPGVKDANTLASGVDRAETRAYYNESADAASLAAAVCFGIAKAHGFNDANKRTAAFCCELFLNLNGLDLDLSDNLFEDMIVNLAAGALNEEGFANMIRPLLRPASDDLEEVEDHAPGP